MSDVHDGGQRVERGARRKENLDNLSAEEASKIAREAIADKERLETENAQLRSANTKANATAQTAATTAAETAIARINDRGKQLEDGLATAKSAEASARAAYKAAREAGDLDAEVEANDAWTAAKVNAKALELQKADFDANKDGAIQKAKNAAVRATAPADNGPSPEIQRWFKEHPKFDTDPDYKKDALDAHALAIEVYKLSTDSPAYLAFLNKELAAKYGADHGKEVENKNDKDQPQRRSMTAAPPGRESDGGVRSSTGALRIATDANGKERVVGEIPAEWVQAAAWNKMDPVDYSLSQIKIEDERRRNNVNEPGVYR